MPHQVLDALYRHCSHELSEPFPHEHELWPRASEDVLPNIAAAQIHYQKSADAFACEGVGQFH